jgi:hypothetical protein
MSQKAAGRASARERNPLELPEGINKRCDLPPEAYWVSCHPSTHSHNANASN